MKQRVGISCKRWTKIIDYSYTHIPISLLAMYCIIFVGDISELMFTMTRTSVKRSTVCQLNITA